MMKDEMFRASNGIVIVKNAGGYLFSDDFDYLTHAAQVALKEYFNSHEQ